MTTPRLLALSDLHVAHPQNRAIVAALEPGPKEDWLLLATLRACIRPAR